MLPEDYERGRQLFPEILDHLAFFEEAFGPYPFRADKYGVAQTPHLGMEHQTIIAYGANFDNGAMLGGADWGFDALHHHELAHEWWGNLVTNADWADMWLHEGFGMYTQMLYIERRQGSERADAFMMSLRPLLENEKAVAPYGSIPASTSSHDIYYKGAWILRTLRYLVGDETFFTSLRRMAYLTPEMEQVTAGRQTRFAVTDDYRTIVEALSGRDLGWFFEVYLRQPELPRLLAERDPDVSGQAGDALVLRWDVPGDRLFPMPVDVEIDGTVRRVEMPDGTARLSVPPGVEVRFDPRHRVLRALR